MSSGSSSRRIVIEQRRFTSPRCYQITTMGAIDRSIAFSGRVDHDRWPVGYAFLGHCRREPKKVSLQWRQSR